MTVTKCRTCRASELPLYTKCGVRWAVISGDIRRVTPRITARKRTCNMYVIHVLFNWMSISGLEKSSVSIVWELLRSRCEMLESEEWETLQRRCNDSPYVDPQQLGIRNRHGTSVRRRVVVACSRLRREPRPHTFRDSLCARRALVACGRTRRSGPIQCRPRRTGTGDSVGLTRGVGVARREHSGIVAAATRMAPRCGSA